MKYVVVGGGNIGTVLAAELKKLNVNDSVFIETSDSKKWGSSIDIYNENDEFLYNVNDICISQDIICDGDVYFFTLPKQILKEKLNQHFQVITNKHAVFVFVPGTGGVEYLLPKDSAYTFVGLQRTPYIARIKEYGKKAYMLSKKDKIYFATLGNQNNFDLEKIIGISCEKVHNFLEVTLTPSNPILHTSRLYTLFSSNDIMHQYDSNIMFYSEWSDNSSKCLLACDRELQNIKKVLKNTDLSMVKSLLEHYGVSDVESATKKIRSIKAFKNIESPMIKTNNGKYIVDLNSRYFTEDFEFGLVIIKSILQICRLKTPSIDLILAWYQDIFNKKIIKNGTLIIQDYMIVPQNAGITSIEELERYYS